MKVLLFDFVNLIFGYNYFLVLVSLVKFCIGLVMFVDGLIGV